jgi:hypothetical protein
MATLRSIVSNTAQIATMRGDALQILAARGEENGLFIGLENDPEPAIAKQVFLTLVERHERATIERELARLLGDDSALKAGEVEIGYDSSLNWIGKIRQEFAWDKLKRLRERALRLQLDRVTMIMTGALAQIDRPATARIIRQQLDAAPVGWRHYLQASAVEMEQSARIEKAQQTPFDAVLRKLRGSTSADKLLVLCEGTTDEPVFRALLAQVPDIPQVIFDSVGGWSTLENKDPQAFLRGAKEAIVVMDGDNGRKLDKKGRPLTGRARTQTTRLKAAGIELRVLGRYGIENYFPRHALETLLQKDLSGYFPMPHDGRIEDHLDEEASTNWRRLQRIIARIFRLRAPNARRPLYAKSRNRDVAALISLDRDLAGTDLRTIIYEIAEIARRLSAE